MSNELIQVRVPRDMKTQAEEVFAAMGMKTGEAIRVFLQQTINSNGLPFQPQIKVPNAETLAAIEGLKNGEGERLSLEKFREQLGLGD